MGRAGVSYNRDNMIAQQLLQFPDEAAAMVDLMLAENVRSYLEVGLRTAATFYYVGERLPPGSRLVGIDWLDGPGRHLNQSEHTSVLTVADELKRSGRDVHLILGDSRSAKVVAAAEKLGPYDFIFIDANHSYTNVSADWANYGPMGRIVSFHDIDVENYPGISHKKLARHGVAKLWRKLRGSYRHMEIIGTKRGFGHGILWRE
jgi:hypothetical protein